MAWVKEKGRIDNAEYQKLTGVTKRTASRDLDALEKVRLLARFGQTGRGTYYTLIGATKGTKGP